MGLRFRRSVKLLPGVRLNISASGITTSIGTKGAWVTLGGKRKRVTAGISGTGISYTTLLPQGQASSEPSPVTSTPGGAVWLALIVLIALIAFCSWKPAPYRPARPSALADVSVPSTVASASPIEASTPYFVAADALNVRETANGTVVGSVTRGSRVDVYETANGWSRISARTAPARWVSTSRLCSTEGCFEKSKVKPAKLVGAAVATAAVAGAVAATKKRSAVPNYSSSCPCSSSSNCYGPRGGRYCITSGGNKRYR